MRGLIETMPSSNTWARLISYVLSTTHVLLTLLVGFLISALISSRWSMDPLLLVFAATSKFFASASTEDRNAPRRTRIYSTIALMFLFPLLIGFSTFEIMTGVLILLLYSLYPFVDGKAPFDVIHHVVRYVLVFVLGYGSQAFFNETALSAVLVIALFSLAGELLAGLGKNGDTSKSTASLLGVKRSLMIGVFTIFMASLMAVFVLNDTVDFPIQIDQTFVPFCIIPALAIDLFLTIPLIKALNGKRGDPFYLMRRRELTTILIASLSALIVIQAGRTSTEVAVNSRNYSFDVGIRTFAAGPYGWNVPWIVFDYVNESNYYYVVFHKDGTLELSLKTNGQTRYYESSLKTQQTPFQWHNFHILLNETTVAAKLDEEYQLSTTRQFIPDSSSIIISQSMTYPTVIWTARIDNISTDP